MADAAVEFLLGNLKQLLVYNASLISNVKDQVDSLCNDLRLLAAFVKETTESRNKHAVVKELVRRIRIEVYKAEDIVDMSPPAVEEENVVGFDKEAEMVVGWLKADSKELEVSSVVDVKADLWKLLQLRHVYTSAASDLPTPSSKSRKGSKDPLVNENLRTMSKVSPNSCTDVILARTPNLQKLGVRGNLTLLLDDKKGSCKFDNIAKLSRLEKLKLLNDTYPIPPLDGKLRGLPEWYKFPPKLKKLTLSDTMLNWEEMSVIGKLLGLEVLKLGDNAFVGERWVTPDGGFVQLRVLQIGKTDLVHWEAFGHQFPQLQRVRLKHCEQLVKIPLGLGDISTLEVMELSWTSRLAIASARSIQKNFKLLVFPPDQETQA
ncbi:hypothetical protein L1987_61661 [Smallanthus sonchifolius]|uniref:Uncharacterized protein n=1 Tax=Smallanthus sonchifolius TaxID=185202 RepID=A0ACB9C895_9ASTR|nr:hypothetical protein L1987_61661 [Smallanthus sonchifolius]